MSLFRLLGALALLLPATLAGAAPRAYEAEYTFVRGGLRAGRVVQTLALDGKGGYRLDMHLEPTGIARVFTSKTLTERSEGVLVQGLPRPGRFEHRPAGSAKAQTDYRNFVFDRKAGKIVDSGASRVVVSLPAPVQTQAQDDLSQLETLRAALAEGKRSLELPVLYAGKDTIYTYRYTVAAKESVQDATGTRYAAVRVTRTDSRGKYRYELWCAPTLDYLPVRIERYRREHHEAGLLLVRYTAAK